MNGPNPTLKAALRDVIPLSEEKYYIEIIEGDLECWKGQIHCLISTEDEVKLFHFLRI